MSLRHQFAWYMGITNPSGWPYLAWSGFGGCLRDLGTLALCLWVRRPVHIHHHYHQGEK